MLGVERVACRADGPDEVVPVPDVERLTEAADMDVDGARIDVGIVAPDRVQESLAREDAARMLEEMLEQPEFGRAERNLLAGPAHAMRRDIHFHIGISKLLAGERGPYA